MKNKKIILIIFFSILTITSIAGVIFSFIYYHQLWTNEFNAQTEKFGFYKSDIKLLNQEYKYTISGISLIFNVLGTVGNIVTVIYNIVTLKEEKKGIFR